MKNKRLLHAIRQLTELQLDALIELLDGQAALLYVEVVPYALDAAELGFRLRHLDSETYYVVSPTGCTCPDSRYRSALCKHVKALLQLFAVRKSVVVEPCGRAGNPGFAEFARIAESWGHP